mmetsp:Transcript_13320/g.53429  ORF Transcript_13320/g.53429 Transcript_13320/m.53429 type:complete len:332 (+) Transcript_13320:994-1989(+)
MSSQERLRPLLGPRGVGVDEGPNVALAELEAARGGEGSVEVGPRVDDGVDERVSAREAGRDGRRERAARAVRVGRVDARRDEVEEGGPVVEDVDDERPLFGFVVVVAVDADDADRRRRLVVIRRLEFAALDEDALRSKAVADLPRRLADLGARARDRVGLAQQQGRLAPVRRAQRREWEQPPLDRRDRVGLDEPVAEGRDHDGVGDDAAAQLARAQRGLKARGDDFDDGRRRLPSPLASFLIFQSTQDAARTSMPVLATSAPMSPSTASIWLATKAGSMPRMPWTPRVFCAVSAVIAVAAKAPVASQALTSAWMPAPPPAGAKTERQSRSR